MKKKLPLTTPTASNDYAQILADVIGVGELAPQRSGRQATTASLLLPAYFPAAYDSNRRESAMPRVAAKKPNFEDLVAQAKKLAPAQRAKLIDLLAEDLEAESVRPVRRSSVPIHRSPGVGMWKDREGMRDSVAWVQELRRREEQRSRR